MNAVSPGLAPSVAALDHLVIGADDLDAVAATLQRIGFLVTPPSGHPALGTRNRTIVLPGLYVEWLHCPHPPADPADYRHILHARSGVSGFALRTDSAEREAARLGVNANAFNRPLDPADPHTPEARFAVASVPGSAAARFFAFYCQHFTPDLVWRADFAPHPNGVTRVLGVDGVFRDLSSAHAEIAARIGPAPGALHQAAANEPEGFRVVRLGARDPAALGVRCVSAGIACRPTSTRALRACTAADLGVDLVFEADSP